MQETTRIPFARRRRYRFVQDVPAEVLLHHLRETATTAVSFYALLNEFGDLPKRAQQAWRLYMVEFGGEIKAGAALRRFDGLCFLHGIERPAVQGLARYLIYRDHVAKLSGEHQPLSWVFEDPDIAGLIRRDHRELFMVMRPYGHALTPDGNYRPAEVRDIPVLEAYARGYSKERAVEFHRDWRELVDRREVFVADSRPGEEPAGVAACVMKGARAGPFASLGGVYTFPPYRNRGYASQLVVNVAMEYFAEGLYACLMVDDDNAPAIQAYKRAGFIETGDYRNTYLHPPGLIARKRGLRAVRQDGVLS